MMGKGCPKEEPPHGQRWQWKQSSGLGGLTSEGRRSGGFGAEAGKGVPGGVSQQRLPRRWEKLGWYRPGLSVGTAAPLPPPTARFCPSCSLITAPSELSWGGLDPWGCNEP